MKRNVFLAGILAVALVFGLTVTGCDNGDGGNSAPPAASGADLYTFNQATGVGGIYTGTAQTVTVLLRNSTDRKRYGYEGALYRFNICGWQADFSHPFNSCG
jgi:outer membrane lipoprotein SlyB